MTNNKLIEEKTENKRRINGSFRKMLAIIFSVTAIFFVTKAFAYSNSNFIKQLIIEESKFSKNVYPALALAVAEIESNFNPSAISSAGAVGVMQIMPKTAKTVFNVNKEELFKPRKNIRLGVQFLDQLIDSYGGNTHLALSHYNGGSKVGKWPNSQIIPYTKKYVEKVLDRTKHYQRELYQTEKQQLKQQARIFTAKNKSAEKFSKLQKELNQIEFWLTKSKNLSSIPKPRENLHRLEKQIESNRKSFRNWLEVYNG